MQLCVALDMPKRDDNIDLAKKLKSYDIWLKVGFRSYIRDGKSLIENLRDINPSFKIFLDLKLYDIPNTMADSAYEIANLGVDMFNIHASAGSVAMRAVMDRLRDIPNRPLVLAVTALTSFSDEQFRGIYGASIDTKAREFAIMSYESGLDGVVCSAYESKDIKEATSKEFLTLSPGIRPFAEDSNDQNRVADIAFAKEQSVDFPVVGRPIYQSTDPVAKVEAILEQIGKKANRF